MEESVLPQTQEGAGFEPTLVRQFTVFLENRVGRLQSMLRVLESPGSRIVGLAVEESTDATLVRLISSDADLARQVLAENGFHFAESELLAVELPKRTGEPLVAICSALLSAEINIHYAYPLMLRPRGPAVALYVDDATLAARLLLKKGFILIGESEFKGI
jgi:hypothetical protein